VAAVAFGSVLWMACVGDDPAPSPGVAADGERGGRCFANGTCNGGGLSCTDGLCVLPGDPNPGTDASTTPADGGTEASVGDGSSGEAASEAGDDDAGACPPPAHTPKVVQCNTSNLDPCGYPEVCCTTQGTCSSTGSCAGGNEHVCESSADCFAGANTECCMTFSGSLTTVAKCPSGITSFTKTTCVQKGKCGSTGNGAVLCGKTADCPDPTTICRAVAVDLGNAASPRIRTITVGVCAPK
jgi:hypothetical protein